MTAETGSFTVKKGLAQMLKGGVIMDVVTPEHARIAEDAGACAVMALERVPADIRAEGGVARMSDPELILFDEPTGGLIQEDTDEITHLIRKVNQAGVTVCLIEHKMRMIMDLADRIVVLNYGKKIAEGKPADVAADPQVIEENE